MEIHEFEYFLSQYEKDIYSFCYHLTQNKYTADDLYQDTALRAFESIDKIDSTQNPKSFLISIAVGKWKNEKRKLKRRNEIAPFELYDEFSEKIKITSDSVESCIIKKEINTCIGTLLGQMDDKYRITLILYYLEQYDTEVISKICGIPKGTVKSRLYKGRELIKKSLEKEGYQYG